MSRKPMAEILANKRRLRQVINKPLCLFETPVKVTERMFIDGIVLDKDEVMLRTNVMFDVPLNIFSESVLGMVADKVSGLVKQFNL